MRFCPALRSLIAAGYLSRAALATEPGRTAAMLPVFAAMATFAIANARAALNASATVRTPDSVSLCAGYNEYITHAVIANNSNGQIVVQPPFYKVRFINDCNLFNCGGNVVTRCNGQQICDSGRLRESVNVRFWCFKSSKNINLEVKTALSYPNVLYSITLTADDFACIDSQDFCMATALDGTMV